MPQQWIKDPDAKLDYAIDWDGEDWLNGDTISASTWTVSSGITKVSDSFTSTTTTVWVSGGTAGQSYELTNRITTAQGRIDERTLTLTVQER